MKPTDQSNLLMRAEALSVGYQTREKTHRITKDLNLEMTAGKLICLLGRNGVGKSTLIRTLSGMQPALNGKIFLQNKLLSEMTPRERARQIGTVLTESGPYGIMDTYSMVSLGRHPYSGWFGHISKHDAETIKWALNAVGVESMSHRQISELSDGERQKVMIARALAQEAKILLLDEPTAYLDLTHQVELIKLLHYLVKQQNLAIIVSTHNLELTLRFADELWVLLEDGTLKKGFPESLGLDGTLNNTFGNDELFLDSASGSFQMKQESKKLVQLNAQGESGAWTKRALIRLGYKVIESNDLGIQPALKISIALSNENNEKWSLHNLGQTTAFNDLSSLLEHLNTLQK